jgi:hypothetical protein
MQPFVAHVARFVDSLHAAGLRVSTAELIDLCRALDVVDVGKRAEFRAAAAATLVHAHEDLARFDAVFRSYWERAEPDTVPAPPDDDAPSPVPPPADERDGTARDVPLPGDDAGHGDGGTADPHLPAYSAGEALWQRDFGAMSAAELARARRHVVELARALASSPGRRFVAGGAGPRPDFRRMFRRSAAAGGHAPQLLYRRRRESEVRLVFLCDVSGSMLAYSRFLLQFIYALRHELPRLEAGVFATRMTLITDLIGGRDLDASLARLQARVADWGSGTDIGGCLREFNRRDAHRTLRGRTLLVILSDGWDRGDATLMREQIALLSRRVHSLIWLNPLLGRDGYLPLCRGIRTALPYMDHFLPANNLASLRQLARALRAEWT